MSVVRRIAVLAALAWIVTAAPVASAGSLDACAQRVIRDWYSGGRVSDVYPLPCYRAAIKALPADVLAYSEADRDIARALAFARRGRTETTAPTREPTPAGTPATPSPARPEARAKPDTPAQPATGVAEPNAPSASVPSRPDDVAAPAIERPGDGPSRLASGPEPTDVSAAVPYPVIVLAALAAALLATGAVGWALARRR